MSRELPKPIEEIRKLYPTVWKAFNDLGDRCHEAGPLDEKSRRLVKLALSIGAGLEGATHSAVRSARKAGIKQEEIDHVAVLAVSTLGLPSPPRAFTWIRDKGKKLPNGRLLYVSGAHTTNQETRGRSCKSSPLSPQEAQRYRR